MCSPLSYTNSNIGARQGLGQAGKTHSCLLGQRNLDVIQRPQGTIEGIIDLNPGFEAE